MTNDPCQYVRALPLTTPALLVWSLPATLSIAGTCGWPLCPDTVFFPGGAAGVQFFSPTWMVSKPSTASRQETLIPAPGVLAVGITQESVLLNHLNIADSDSSHQNKISLQGCEHQLLYPQIVGTATCPPRRDKVSQATRSYQCSQCSKQGSHSKSTEELLNSQKSSKERKYIQISRSSYALFLFFFFIFNLAQAVSNRRLLYSCTATSTWREGLEIKYFNSFKCLFPFMSDLTK